MSKHALKILRCLKYIWPFVNIIGERVKDEILKIHKALFLLSFLYEEFKRKI